MNTKNIWKIIEEQRENVRDNYARTFIRRRRTISGRTVQINIGLKNKMPYIVVETIDQYHKVRVLYIPHKIFVEFITPENIKSEFSDDVLGATDYEKFKYALYRAQDIIARYGSPYLGLVRYPAQNPDYNKILL